MNDMIFYRAENMEFVIIHNGVLRFNEHSHAANIVISGITSGNAELVVNESKRTLDNGEIFTVLPYESHSLKSDKPVDLLTMCIDKALFEQDKKTYTDFVSSAIKGLSEKSELSEVEICLADKICEEALTIYDDFEAAYLIETDDLLVKGRKMLESLPENDDDIQSLADNSFMSKYHYIRRFKAISGLSPNKFRLQNRIRKAQKLIINGEKIADAAVMSGFYDQSHFDRYFKRIVGVSPKEYINSLRNFVQE